MLRVGCGVEGFFDFGWCGGFRSCGLILRVGSIRGRGRLAGDGDAGPGFDDGRGRGGGGFLAREFGVSGRGHGQDAVGEVADAHVDADDSTCLRLRRHVCEMDIRRVVTVLKLGEEPRRQVRLGAAGVDACGDGDAFQARELQAGEPGCRESHAWLRLGIWKWFRVSGGVQWYRWHCVSHPG